MIFFCLVTGPVPPTGLRHRPGLRSCRNSLRCARGIAGARMSSGKDSSAGPGVEVERGASEKFDGHGSLQVFHLPDKVIATVHLCITQHRIGRGLECALTDDDSELSLLLYSLESGGR